MYLPDLYDESVMESEGQITDLNREQLDIGLMADGNSLPDYSQTSIDKFGKQPGPIRLYDTGDFWKGFYIDSGADAFDIRSTDEKETMLVDNYSSEIFGLVANQRQRLAEIIKPLIVNKIKNYL